MLLQFNLAAGAWRCPLTPFYCPGLKTEQRYTSTLPLGLRGLLQDEHYILYKTYKHNFTISLSGQGVTLTPHPFLLPRYKNRV
jgi:hypothetical protein